MEEKKFFTSKNIAVLGVLAAFVIVLQIFGSYFVIAGTVRLSFVLVPIVLGAIMTGVVGGMILGLLFGVLTLVMGIAGADPFTFVLFSQHPILTILTCVVKGTAAGFLSGLAYNLLYSKNRTAAVFTASAIAPIVNTGLFILGALLMSDTLSSEFVPNGSSVIYFLIIDCAGINFLIELGINLLLAPSVCRIIKSVRKTR